MTVSPFLFEVVSINSVYYPLLLNVEDGWIREEIVWVSSVPLRFDLLMLIIVILFVVRRFAIFLLTPSTELSLKNFCVGSVSWFGSVWKDLYANFFLLLCIMFC